ncbi:hypothetical protein [Escherichia sp. E14S1]|uniref:hypothetical protein n=1 Tax=Escherichia sp. E14S1 TaxID=2478968 RepID=UPI00102947CD|nr:hypothetical protein [Escherichia sp. E14S1]RZN17088.1 hypothetical protein D9734_22120 [Escherichia sp. E14S1]
MIRINKERISEIISRIEMYGHGAGYTADEVLALAQMALATCKDGKTMKLIDLLVKELPKCGGWPDGMSYCHILSVNLMAPCATFAFGSDHKKDQFYGRNFCREIELPIRDLDSDEYQSVVSREQYEAALIASQKVEFNGDELESKACKLDFEQWLEQQRGKIDVDCGCVSAETFMHWLRVAYEAGNHPDLPDSPQQAPRKSVKTTLERGYLEAALKIKPGHTLGVIDAMLIHEMAKALLPLEAD